MSYTMQVAKYTVQKMHRKTPQPKDQKIDVRY